jgi:hypothetical protein
MRFKYNMSIKYIGIVFVTISVIMIANCGSKDDEQPGPEQYALITSPPEPCKMIIDYINYTNPGIWITAEIYPHTEGISVTWFPSDAGGLPNWGLPINGTCNPISSLTNSDGRTETYLSPGTFGETFYGGDDYRVTAAISGYGSATSPTVTLHKKMHIETDWQTGYEPKLIWIDSKFSYTYPGPSARAYILAQTHIDETNLSPMALHEWEMATYVSSHRQYLESYTVYLCGIRYDLDDPTALGLSRPARGDTGWSLICVEIQYDLANAYPDSIGWLDTLSKSVTIHELGHQTFLADDCDVLGCIMDGHIRFGERDTLFCNNHLSDMKSIPQFWPQP